MKARSRILTMTQLVAAAALLILPAVSNAQWRRAQPIDGDATGHAARIDLAMTPEGRAVVIWEETLSVSEVAIWANTYTRRGGFNGALNIGKDDEGAARFPQIAIASDGTATAVWHRDPVGSVDTRVSSNSFSPANGGRWAGREDHTDPDATYPQIAMNERGDMRTVYMMSVRGGPLNILGKSNATGSSGFGSAQLLENEAGEAFAPVLAVSEDGTTVAAWEQINPRNGSRVIRANVSIGSTWIEGASKEIGAGSGGDAEWVRVAINPSGTEAVAVWHQRDGIRDDVYGAIYRRSIGQWSMSEPIGRDPSRIPGNALYPQVAMDSIGNTLVLWIQQAGAGSNFGVHWSRRGPNFPEWSSNVPFPNAHNVRHVQLAMNSRGNVLAVWLDELEPTSFQVSSRFYSAVTETWGDVMPVSGTTVSSLHAPKVGLDENNRGLAAWVETIGGRSRAMASVFAGP